MPRLPTPSWLWNNDAHSDVTLQLHATDSAATASTAAAAGTPRISITEPDAGALHGRPKAAHCDASSLTAPEAARCAEAAGAHQEAGSMAPITYRTYRLHAVTLSSCSEYFKTRLMPRPAVAVGGASLQYAAPSNCDICGLGRMLLTEHVAAAELDAMEAVLRYCYTGQLPEGDSVGAKVGIDILLRMLVLADRFGVLCCMSHCSEELATRSAAEFSVATINGVLSLPASVQALASLVATQLCHAAVVLLLASDELEAISEDSVLIMADAWMSGPVGSACSAAEGAQVAGLLRLGQLSHTFTFDVVQRLTWLPLSVDQATSLMRYVAADAELRAFYVRKRIAVGPSTWYISPSRPPTACSTATMEIEVGKAKLAADLLVP